MGLNFSSSLFLSYFKQLCATCGSGAAANAATATPLLCGPTVDTLLLQSAAGTGFRVYAGGTPLVVADPSCETAGVFMELGAAVVRELAKLQALPRNAVRCRSSLAPLSRPAPGSHHLTACSSCRPTTHLPSPAPATRLSLPCPPSSPLAPTLLYSGVHNLQPLLHQASKRCRVPSHSTIVSCNPIHRSHRRTHS